MTREAVSLESSLRGDVRNAAKRHQGRAASRLAAPPSSWRALDYRGAMRPPPNKRRTQPRRCWVEHPFVTGSRSSRPATVGAWVHGLHQMEKAARARGEIDAAMSTLADRRGREPPMARAITSRRHSGAKSVDRSDRALGPARGQTLVGCFGGRGLAQVEAP